MSTITAGGTVITPTAVTEYQSTRAGGNVVHRILGRTDPDVTLRPAQLRTGTLEAIFTSEADSRAAEVAVGDAGVMQYADDVSTVNMTFVLGEGGVQRTIHESRAVWLLTIDYVEVLP